MFFDNSQNGLKKRVHFIGIGGIGMSGLAMILNKIGCTVSGSDLTNNDNIATLEKLGVKSFIGHQYQNIDEATDLVIKTSIVKDNNPEIISAKEKNITIIRRADLLAMMMKEKIGVTVAGTHGKTSTTAMTALLFETAGFDPLVINGGIINYYGSNAKFGLGKYLVAESDESDASFVDLPTFIGVVTNIEPEHLEFYGGNFDLVKSHFKRYITQIPQDGLAVLCIDDIEVKKIYDQIKNSHNIISCGLETSADISASNISFDVDGIKFDANIKKSAQIITDIKVPIYGIHNVKNALAIVAIASFLSIDDNILKKALSSYSGVKRRFTKTGEVGGITIIDDYAHHPTEIKATIKAARDLLGKEKKLITVFQPHKYSRVRDLFNEFCEAFNDTNIVIVADIYSAGQEEIEGINQDALISGITKAGHKNVIKLKDKNELPILIKDLAKTGDMVLCVGAGNITAWAKELPNLLKSI